MTCNRAVIADIRESIKCGVDAVAISTSTSDIYMEPKLRTTRDDVLKRMSDAVKFAKDKNLYVSVIAEDASRSDPGYLTEFALVAKHAGANRLRFCDTVGTLTPLTTFRYIKTLHEWVGLDIEMYTHNDFGMATANSLAGIYAGANHVGVTVNGWGGRAGNSCLQEVILGMRHLLKIDVQYNTTLFREIAQYAAQASGRALSVNKPIVGSNIFAHESGIHGDGVLKNPLTYEAFTPEEVGLKRQMVIGKHSGSASIKAIFREYGIEISDPDTQDVLARCRQLSIDKKRSLLVKEIARIYEELVMDREKGPNTVVTL
jgi:homocitrate synthase NifV